MDPDPVDLALRDPISHKPLKVYFSCKNSTFCDDKPGDPDPHWFGSPDPGSALR